MPSMILSLSEESFSEPVYLDTTAIMDLTILGTTLGSNIFAIITFSVNLTKCKWPPDPSKLASMTRLVETLSNFAFPDWLNSVHSPFHSDCALPLCLQVKVMCAKSVIGL